MTKFYRIILLFASSLFACVAVCASDDDLDSLARLADRLPDDTTKLRVLYEVSLGLDNADSTLKYSSQLVSLSRKLNDAHNEMRGLGFTGWAYYYMGEYDKSLESLFASLSIADSLKDELQKVRMLMFIGNTYSSFASLKAIDYYKQALVLAEVGGHHGTVKELLFSMAQEYSDHHMFDDAERCIDKLSESELDRSDSAMLYWACGYNSLYKSYVSSDTLSKIDYSRVACGYLWQSVDKADGRLISRGYEFLAEAYMKIYDYSEDVGSVVYLDSCQMCLEKALVLKRQCDGGKEASILISLAECHLSRRQFSSALHMADSLYTMYPDLSYSEKKMLADFYSRCYVQMERPDKAVGYYDILVDLYRQSDGMEVVAGASRIAAEAEYEMSLVRHEAEEKALVTSGRWRMAVIVLMAIGLVCFLYSLVQSRRRNARLNEQNVLLEEQHEEIMVQNESLENQKSVIEAQKLHLENQNKLISKANKDLVDSMNYAKQIQKAAMPNSLLHTLFVDNMVFLKPLNIVSGDFYWCAECDGRRLLAVGDCTGHGVPGGFLSMLGISLLNDLALGLRGKEYTAADVLSLMDAKFQQALNQSSSFTSNRDGIDLAIVVVDPDRHVAHYAGAFRPMCIVGRDGLRRIDADRRSVGVSLANVSFSDHVVEYHDGDAIYIYSDGMTDQFGYDGGREVKFGRARLEGLLSDIWRLPMSAQETKVTLAMEKWRVNLMGEQCEQLDDMLLVGVKL